MALTNLFDGVATENTAGSIDRNAGISGRAIQTPKTSGYLDRVVVDNTVGTYVYRTYLWDGGAYTTWWNQISAFSVDQRQIYSEQVRTNAISCRNRWST